MKHFMNCFKNLAKERNELVMKHAHGRLLDIGCGKENYIEKHRPNSVGVDKDSDFCFDVNSFDTIAMVASFNYMTREEQNNYLVFARAMLKECGKLIITCVTPFGSRLKAKDGEKERGIGRSELIDRVEKHGFTCLYVRPFNFHMNNLFVFIR